MNPLKSVAGTIIGGMVLAIHLITRALGGTVPLRPSEQPLQGSFTSAAVGS